MLRLTTFCTLVALAVAQNGYEYNKPRNPFPSSSSRPGFPPGLPGSYPTTTSYPDRQQNNDYPGSSTPGFPSGPSNYPTGPQGFPGSTSNRPQSGFPGQDSSYPGRGPSTDGYQDQNGPSYPGGPGGPGQGTRYPGSSGFGPNSGSPGFGTGSPGFGGPGFRPGTPGFGSGSEDTGEYVGGDYSAIPGQPDIDYPIFSYIPATSFSCDSQAYPGYYADVETRCQVFHICANNKTYDFLCPNGTIFSQEFFVCVWWDQFDCNSAPSLYGLNANLYDYSITGSNDYSQGSRGPSYSGGRPQGPSSGFPGSSGPQGPSSGFPGSSGPQGPSSGYPGSSGPSGFPGSGGPQGPSNNGYPGDQSYGTGPQGPSNNGYPGDQSYGTGPQGPSTSYPGTGPGFLGTSRPGSPGSYPTSTPYPSNIGSQGPSTSGGPGSYPGTRPGSYPGSGPSNYPGSNTGYPSDKPSGPGFPTGGSRPQQPNREYLPPN